MSQWTNIFFDTLCATSLLGIWPRFIEPKIIKTHQLSFSSPKIQANDIRVVQITDLHFHSALSTKYIHKIFNKINALKPDLVVITGDFLVGSKMLSQDHYDLFFSQLTNNYPVYASLGNHDYSFPIRIDSNGSYARAEQSGKNPFIAGIKLLLKRPPSLTGKHDVSLNRIQPSSQLLRLLKNYGIELLHNSTKSLQINRSHITLAGLADYMTPLFDPELTFKDADKNFFHLTLSHNPDSAILLDATPSDLILSGHTHGGQINLPYIRSRISIQENPKLLRGLHRLNNSSLYISRGLCRYPDFRLFSFPEITCITLTTEK